MNSLADCNVVVDRGQHGNSNLTAATKLHCVGTPVHHSITITRCCYTFILTFTFLSKGTYRGRKQQPRSLMTVKGKYHEIKSFSLLDISVR